MENHGLLDGMIYHTTMAHVSRKKIKKQIAAELADQFLTFLTVARTKKDAHIFADELFSQTERVMLAKRLAIVILLVRGYSFTQVEESLGVTRQTVVRIWKDIQSGGYRKIASYARKHTRHFEEESAVDAFIRILHLGMPPRAGKRWQQLNKLLGFEG
ncbi:MAG: Trp family transcriptional regulator [Minisyncoccia bacterium]